MQLIIADILDQLVVAIEVARINAAGNARWLNALEVGYNWLVQQDTITYDADTHELTVPSASSEGRTYRSNGACQCQAFESHQACWHRAACRLVRRALELSVVVTRPKPKPNAEARAKAWAEAQELWT